MESASVLGVLSSWEVIVAGLLLMLLLPLVFTIASLKSPARRPVLKRGGAGASGGRVKGARRTEGAQPRAEGDEQRAEEGARGPARPRSAQSVREPDDGDAEDKS